MKIIKFKDDNQFPIKDLKPNPGNDELFKKESAEYFNDLHNSIKKLGVLVPLIIKNDNTILCGHNRYIVAKALGIKTIPVRIIVDNINSEEELSILKDENAKRRHLSRKQRMELYHVNIVDLDTMILQETRGTNTNISKNLSKLTGIPEAIVKLDIKDTRRDKEKQIYEKLNLPNAQVVGSASKKLKSLIGMCQMDTKSTVIEVISMTENILKQLNTILKTKE